MTDMINHPPHYTQHPSGVECIQITEWFTFGLGNVIKYVWRAGLKGDGPLEDLRKAKFYLEREIERLENAAAQDDGGARRAPAVVEAFAPGSLKAGDRVRITREPNLAPGIAPGTIGHIDHGPNGDDNYSVALPAPGTLTHCDWVSAHELMRADTVCVGDRLIVTDTEGHAFPKGREVIVMRVAIPPGGDGILIDASTEEDDFQQVLLLDQTNW